MTPPGRLTSAAIADLVAWLPPQEGEVVVLPFVRQQDGRYLMAAPINCCWLELLSLVNRGMGGGQQPEVQP